MVNGVVDGVLVSYDKFNDDDKDPPKLIKVTSIPPKGARVKAGDQIKVTIKASDVLLRLAVLTLDAGLWTVTA